MHYLAQVEWENFLGQMVVGIGVLGAFFRWMRPWVDRLMQAHLDFIKKSGEQMESQGDNMRELVKANRETISFLHRHDEAERTRSEELIEAIRELRSEGGV